MWIGRLTMPNGTSTGRRAVAPLAIMAALLGAALLIAYAGVPLAEAQSPPGTPSSVSLTRADGTVTASWPAVSGATKYHVTYSSDGKQSWSAASDSHTSNSITFNADNGKSYIVGVRAGNGAEQWSGWRNSPSIGPYTPPDPDPTPTPTPAPNPPGTPSSVTVTRGDGTFSADWPDVSGATKYHVTYSTDNRQSWSHATSSRPYSDITINGADNAKTYIVAVRAGNSAGWGGWRNSDPAGPYVTTPGAPASVTVTRGDGTITASWDAPAGATKYHVTYSANGKRTWTAASDNHTSSSITITANNGKTYHVAVRAGNSAGWSGWRNSAASAPTATPGIIVQDSSGNAITSLTVPEGGEATYQVKLASQPDAYVEICIGLSVRDRNDGSITFKGEPAGTVALKVPFTPENWDTAQTVTLVAAEDDDSDNGVRDVINDTRDFVEYFSGAVWLEVTEIDNDPIPGPSNLSVTPGDGYMDIAWDAVSGATGYDVKAQAANTSNWITVASNITDTSYRYTTNATIDYVGVRSRNANGPGPWTELSRAPNENWLNTVQQSGGASLQMAESQAQGQSQTKLAAPTLGTITRDHGTRETGSDQSITINWTAVTGATGYNVACSATDGWSWWGCGAITSGSTTTLTVDNGESGNDLGKNRSYKLAVRAVNATPADASAWTNSVNIRPVIAWPRNVASTRGDGSITLSWTPNAWTTGYLVDCAISDRTPPYSDPVYTRCATLTGQVDTATTHTVTIPHSTNSSYTIDNTKHYDIKITSTNQWGQAAWLAPIIAPLRLNASSVGLTSATLNLPSSYSAAWWYKRIAPSGDNTCHSVSAGTTSADLSSLTSGQNYTYKAYSATGCNSANEIAAVSFATSASVSNLTVASDNIGSAIDGSQSQASGFTTGGNSGGYKLLSVTAKFRDALRTPTGFVAEIRLEGAGGNPSDDVLYTLSGPDPTTAGDHTFTCSGSCQLAASTPYFLVMKAGVSTGNHRWDTTGVFTETNAPIDFGWTIADEGKTYSSGNWSTDNQWVGMFKVSATKNSTLTASDAIAGQATLTITNWTGAWYYKADTGPHATCQGPASGTTASLNNLVKGTRYVYSAYSDAECTNANLLATASAFTTPSITVSNVGTTSATIRLFNFAAQWWYKADSGPDGSCQGPVGARDNENLTGLTQGTPYLYKAYSKSGCAETDYVTDVYFTTTAPGLTVSNITDTAATLTLAGHTGNWYYKANAAPDNTCKGPVTNSTTKNLTGLTSGTSYTYEAFSDSTCTTANRLATATAFTTGASYVTNLSSANTGQALISDIRKQAVAFTTGSNANGYTLSNITASLRESSDGGSLTVTLHQMQGTGTYGASSSPSDTALATLTGTDPTNIAWADTTYTCSGSGCSLSANTTYFLVMESSRAESFAWSVADTSTESTYPTNSGWSIGYGHSLDTGGGRPWFSHGNHYPVRVVFTTTP